MDGNSIKIILEIKKHASEEAALVLVGNKLDIQENREVSTVEA